VSETSDTSQAPAVKTVTLTIDGREVTVPEGTPVIEAAARIGTDISSFCYHPGLSVVAVCRQCLVGVEGSPKLVPSCQAVCTDGMVVTTTDERSSTARRQMLEFTLVNHPVDCPICDKAGECTLQELYFDHDNKASRLDVPKVRKPKVVDLGPHVVLDAERCILCDRCVRVCDEVAGVHQLEFRNRGDHTELGTAPGARLDNPYSLNTVDVCPVGALTSKDYRFTMRAWQLYFTPSVCQGCATGCNMEIQHASDRVWRLVPRKNLAVNEYWMCDEGRFTYHELREERLVAPLLDGLPASWDRALGEAAAALAAADRGSVGVVLSAHHTNEANWLLSRLARDHLGVEKLYLGAAATRPERADDILMDADVSPNRAGVTAIAGGEIGDVAALERDIESGVLSALIVLGHQLPLADLESVSRLGVVIAISDREVGIAARARIALPAASWAEIDGTVTNRQGRVQRMHAAYPPMGQSLPAWEIVAKLARTCDAAMDYDHPRKVFTQMVEATPAFSGARWGRSVRPLQLRFANSRG
jgi:NADH-quinone oxidoreductase subunit G